MIWRRVFLSLLLFITFTQQGSAANTPVIVQLTPTGVLADVLTALGGTLIDTAPDGTSYLINATILPSTAQYPGLGIDTLEQNKAITLTGARQIGVVRVPATSASDWYKTQPLLTLIHSQAALSYSRGHGIIVADINSIVDYSHPALSSHLTSGYDFVNSKPNGETSLNQSSSEFLDQSSSEFLDQSSSEFLDQSSSEFLDNTQFLTLNPAYSHGTLCAGIIAVMAPDAMIMPLRAFDDQGSSDAYMIAKAIRYAARHGADVINMSFGSPTDSNVIKNAIDFAKNRGVIVIASAGNNNSSTPQYPAAYSTVISVSASDIADTKASFSNYGSFVNVDAPGVHVISAFPGNLYSIVSGTSFAAPMVAAEVALIQALQPTTDGSPVLAGTVNINAQNPNYLGQLGTGRIDALKTVHP